MWHQKLCIAMYGNNSGHGYGNGKCHHGDHYDSKDAAKQAARRMGKSGYHSMQCKGKTVYMPCSSHSEYMDAKESSGGNGSGIDPSAFGL